MKKVQKFKVVILVAVLALSVFFVGYHVYRSLHPSDMLKVAFLDIGQGDSIYIEAPNGKQILIDGGPNQSVVSRLAQVMPWGDHSLDVILATHADADHIGGLSAVLDRYTVGAFIDNGVAGKTKTFAQLHRIIDNKKIPEIIAHKGMHLVLDKEKNIYVDILFPDRDVSNMDSNDGSIVCRLVYGDESFMFTGDATVYTENLIEQNSNPQDLHSTVLKLGHHGSHTSSSEGWLHSVAPKVAVISAGLHNRYGHPHQEILDRLASLHIPYLATYLQGTLLFQTDGKTLVYP